MKSPSKKPREKAIKELASQIEADFTKTLPITVRQDGRIVYKNFLIKKDKSGDFMLINLNGRSLIEKFHLKTCALMAAKTYAQTNIIKFLEVKRLDSKYWSNFMDSQVYQKNIKTAKEFDHYCILLNKLEYSQEQTDYYKDAISTMFKWSFV